MLSWLLSYLSDKVFNKPVVGTKRKHEDWTDYPPQKQMRFETASVYRPENSYHFVNSINRMETVQEEDDEICVTNEIFTRKWGPPLTRMGRQSIHDNSKFHLNSVTSSVAKRKSDLNANTAPVKPPQNEPDLSEVEVVKCITKNPGPSSGKVTKNKSVTSRIFSSYQPSNSRQNAERTKSTFQSSIKKSQNFLKEGYRLSEKVQYMQLLQQQTAKLNPLLSQFSIQKVGSRVPTKSSIPVIDLTKEKSNVVVNRSRESIPWTSSWTKSESDVLSDTTSETKEVPRINTLQDMLKTHAVTEKSAVEEILSKHATETAHKRRQVEIEAAKVKVLSESNRKSYTAALEEKLRNYMRITTPALEEIEPTKEKYVLPELTKEQLSKVASVLIPSPSGEVLVEKFGLQIKRRDLQTLKGLNWLNDEVINFYMNLIMERGKGGKLPSVYAFNTFFYPKLISSGHASLRRWTKKVDIFSHDLILVPIHLGMHWCMAVIDFRSREVRYYDSMGSPNDRCLEALLTYLRDESMDKKGTPYETGQWDRVNVGDIPQQMNGSDCGVFSCVFAEHLARDCPLLFSQDHMPYFRRKMALEIVEAKLLT